MCINDLKLGDKACIQCILGDSRLVKRLNALGCTKGCMVELTHKAPFGDPIVFSLRGYSMAIRKKDAMNILVGETE